MQERKDWLTPEILEVLMRCFDMREVTTREFWQWLWPLDSQPLTFATIGPVSPVDVEDICARARCFTMVDSDVPEWFSTRMASSHYQ